MENNTEYNINKISLLKTLLLKDENLNQTENFQQSIEIRSSWKKNKNRIIVNLGVQILIGSLEEIEKVETSKIYIDAEYQGEFEIVNQINPEQEKFFIEVNCPTIIYPFLREHVLNIANKSQISPIILPPYYFHLNSKNEKQEIM